MTEAILANIYPIAVTVALACFGAYLAWRNGYKSRRAVACAEFKRVFLTEISSFYPVISDWPPSMHQLLAPKFHVFQAAVSNFSPYVPFWRRWQFKRAWARFHNSNLQESDKPAFIHYTSRICFGNQTQADRLKETQALFSKDVRRLLSFADET